MKARAPISRLAAHKRPLSKRQSAVLNFIRDRAVRRELPPTFEEIGRATGVSSKNAVSMVLDVLEAQGYIERDRRISRGIRPVKRPANTFDFVGQVSAGGLVTIFQTNETITFDPRRHVLYLVEG